MLILAYLAYPQDTGPKLKVLKMFKRRPGEVQGGWFIFADGKIP